MATSQGQPRRECYGLIDIENIAHDNHRHVTSAALATVAARLQGLLTGWSATVALQTGLAQRYGQVLSRATWDVLVVDAAPDAADVALVEVGWQAVRSGVTDLIVVSGDRRFASLAAGARLHVVCPPDRRSRRLAVAATSVTPLVLPYTRALRVVS